MLKEETFLKNDTGQQEALGTRKRIACVQEHFSVLEQRTKKPFVAPLSTWLLQAFATGGLSSFSCMCAVASNSNLKKLFSNFF